VSDLQPETPGYDVVVEVAGRSAVRKADLEHGFVPDDADAVGNHKATAPWTRWPTFYGNWVCPNYWAARRSWPLGARSRRDA